MEYNMVNLPGVKQSFSKEYYYSDDDIKMITVPIGQCQGDFNLHPEELKKYFGIEPDRMGTLPQYLITPYFDSTLNNSRSCSTERFWWDITGEIVVYQPLEWVPIVRDLGTVSASAFEREFERKTTTIETSQIYGNNVSSFKVRAGFSWKVMKLDVSDTTTVGVSYSINKEVHKEIVERGKYGELLVKKVALGMGLKVKRVFEHGVKLYLNDEKKCDSLNWDGPESWDDILVPASALRDVSALQFHPIKMSGGGYDSLWLQVLPVFYSNRTLTDMHVLFSSGWTSWYAYLHGSKVVNGGRVETIVLPDNKPPLVTFMLLTPTNPTPYYGGGLETFVLPNIKPPLLTPTNPNPYCPTQTNPDPYIYCPTQTGTKPILSGVKQNSAGEYYYNDNDIKMITVPIGECQGDIKMLPAKLKRYFGVESHKMGSLPEYLITPLLNSTRNKSRSLISGCSWWDITGEVVVYQPVEWVPFVHNFGTFPADDFERELEKTTTSIDQSSIYRKQVNCWRPWPSFAMEASIGGKFINLKDIKNTSCTVNQSISEEVHKEIVEKRKHGLLWDLWVKKVVLGMGLKVKRVFEHEVKLYLNDEEKGDSLTWDGPEARNDIRISHSALRNVFPLLHYPFGRLLETFPTNSLKLLPLPVFDAHGTLTDMHVVLGAAGWDDWYAYLHGSKVVDGGKVEILALPLDKVPQVTFSPMQS